MIFTRLLYQVRELLFSFVGCISQEKRKQVGPLKSEEISCVLIEQMSP